MKQMRWSWAGAAGVALIGLVGCGGGGSGPAPVLTTTIDGGLSQGDFFDNSQNRFFDDYLVRARTSRQVFVDLRSDDFDSHIFVFRRDNTGAFVLIADDDDGGEDDDSLVRFDAIAGVDYLIRVTSARGNDNGFYRVIFDEALGTPQVIVPGPGANAMKLPKLAPLAKKAARS